MLQVASPDQIFSDFESLPQISFCVKPGEMSDKLATQKNLCRVLMAEFQGIETRRNTGKLQEKNELGFLAPLRSQLSPEKVRTGKNTGVNLRQNSNSVLAKSKDYRISKKLALAMSTGVQNGTEPQAKKVTKSLRWKTLESVQNHSNLNRECGNIFDTRADSITQELAINERPKPWRQMEVYKSL